MNALGGGLRVAWALEEAQLGLFHPIQATAPPFLFVLSIKGFYGNMILAR